VEIFDICQQQRKRLGLSPNSDPVLTQNPGTDVQSAAFDGSAPPRINLATYSHAALVSFDGHNAGVFDPASTQNAAILSDIKAAIAEHAHAAKTGVDVALSDIFDIGCGDYPRLPLSRKAEMIYFTLRKSPILLCMTELFRGEWLQGVVSSCLPRRHGSVRMSLDNPLFTHGCVASAQ